MKVLLTSTSFQDTPGDHQIVLNNQGYDVDTLRGPLKSEELIPIISKYDGIICGDDDINEEVIKKGSMAKLKIISKYGVGLDKIDLISAKKYGIPVTNCIGANHIAVSEHVFGLILSYYKNICLENNITKQGKWDRLIGNEIYGKTIGIIGLGKIGKEVSIRAKSFGLNVIAYDIKIDRKFVEENDINVVNSLSEICQVSNILTLHLNLSIENKNIISIQFLHKFLRKIPYIRPPSFKNNSVINFLRYGSNIHIIYLARPSFHSKRIFFNI